MSPPGRPRIRLITQVTLTARREVARAILEAAGSVDCRLQVWMATTPIDDIAAWREESDAIIFAGSANASLLEPALATGLPLVLLSSQKLDFDTPMVLADERRIGWLAGAHLIERGCKHLAYVGMVPHDGSDLRYAGLVAALADHGMTSPVQRLETTYSNDPTSGTELREQVAALPPSTGILAFSDLVALAVLDAAEQLGRAVPRDLAVVGVGNDDLLCAMGHPTLSSVDADASRIGREALALALQLVRDQSIGAAIRRVEPLGVVARGSTSQTAIVRHPLVRAALERLDEQLVEHMSVDQLLNDLVVSRSTLDRAFRKTIGHTAHEEIRRRRLRLARELLLETNLSGVEIASRTGFRHLSNLSAAFKVAYGVNLSTMRQQHAR